MLLLFGYYWRFIVDVWRRAWKVHREHGEQLHFTAGLNFHGDEWRMNNYLYFHKVSLYTLHPFAVDNVGEWSHFFICKEM